MNPCERSLEIREASREKGGPWKRNAYVMGRDSAKPPNCLSYLQRG